MLRRDALDHAFHYTVCGGSVRRDGIRDSLYGDFIDSGVFLCAGHAWSTNDHNVSRKVSTAISSALSVFLILAGAIMADATLAAPFFAISRPPRGRMTILISSAGNVGMREARRTSVLTFLPWEFLLACDFIPGSIEACGSPVASCVLGVVTFPMLPMCNQPGV